VGVLFHWSIGYRVLPPYPAVLTVGILFTLLCLIGGRMAQRHPVVKWLSGVPFAITTMVSMGLLALLGAFFPSAVIQKVLGVPSLFNTWIFASQGILLQANLLLSTARRCYPLTTKNVCYTSTHFGLSLILFGGVLSGLSLERARLMLPIGQGKSQAELENGQQLELPFALTLRDFTLESFPPTLALAHLKGKKIETIPGHLFAKEGQTEQIGDYRVIVKRFLPRAALVEKNWIAVNLPTAAPAAFVEVQDRAGNPKGEGWVSCGSVDTAGSLVQLGTDSAIVMPQLRPKEYRASATITQKAGEAVQTLRVNRPINVGDYRLYLLSYDEKMGSASEYVIVEAVRDRGIRVVYIGMYLLLFGVALLMWGGISAETRHTPKGERDA
jgi:hypothetical protein